MYKITVINNETGAQFTEYGFSNYILKRLYEIENERNDFSFEKVYDVIWFDRLVVTPKTIKKCILKERRVIK